MKQGTGQKMTSELGFSFISKDEKREEDKVLRVVVTGGLPDLPPLQGPAAYMNHEACPKLLEAFERRNEYINTIHQTTIALTALDDQIRVLEAEYRALLNQQSNHFNPILTIKDH